MKVVTHRRSWFACSFVLGLLLVGSWSFRFADAGDTDFTQCLNDSDNNDAKDNCSWSNGAINQTNSFYLENDSVAQRLFQSVDSAGAYVLRLNYDFTKGNLYAYDFLTTPDITQTGALLNECGDLPGFVAGSVCSTLFANKLLIPIPSDPFDGVAARENPAARNFFFSCEPIVNCTGISISLPSPAHDPSTVCAVGACVSSSVNIDVKFTASGPVTVALWFGGHLAYSLDPAGSAIGWGAGFGASSISGSPFHVALVSLTQNGNAVPGFSGRDNQISGSGVVDLCAGRTVACNDGNVCTIDSCDPASGVCGTEPVSNGTVCNDNNACTQTDTCQAGVCTGGDPKICTASDQCHVAGVCDSGTGSCSNPAASEGTACGSAENTACNAPDTCNGTGTCVDRKKTAGTICLAGTGICDPNDVCDGTTNTCAVVLAAAGEACGDSDNTACNAPDSCNGAGSCVDRKKTVGTICLAGTGICDPDDVCDGTTNTCKPVFASAGTLCRASGGVCDLAETCTGSSPTCPFDAKVVTGTICRAANGICDVAEKCDGSNNACPNDQVADNNTVCRAAAGLCDVAESCNGSDKTCPADAIKDAGTTCRPSAGSCDVAEACDGSSKQCPTDKFVTTGILCRDSAGLCDPEEVCTGNSAVCPVNVVFDPNRDPSCEAEFCQTAGFWSSHAGTEKKNGKSQNITLAVIDLSDGTRNLPAKDLINLNGAYGKLSICGENVVNTQLNDAASALEGMCVSPEGDQRLQLVRQLTAASLNCVLSSGNPDCEGVNGPSNITVEDLFAACNNVCIGNGTTITDGVNTISCIAALDCWNNGGIFHEATNFCQTGTCSLDGVTACNGTSSCPLFNGLPQTCVALATTCHDQRLVKDGFFDFDPPGPAGSTDACNQAIGNKCTVIAPGEVSCSVDSAP